VLLVVYIHLVIVGQAEENTVFQASTYTRSILLPFLVVFSLSSGAEGGGLGVDVEVAGCSWSLHEFYEKREENRSTWFRANKVFFSSVNIVKDYFNKETELKSSRSYLVSEEPFKDGTLTLFFTSNVNTASVGNEVNTITVFVFEREGEHLRFVNTSRARLEEMIVSCESS
jgi:hypothetical protein